MHSYGRYFRAVRSIARVIFPKYTCADPINTQSGVVFVCRHRNMNGPLTTLTWLENPVHVWALHVFEEKDKCFHQFYDYTFTQRLGWPKWAAYVLAKLISLLEPPLFESSGMIPVYRNSAHVIKTYRKSLEALKNGENVLLFPDVDYADGGSEVGALYDGYLLLHRLYRHETGKDLPFIPLYIDDKAHAIRMGEAVLFDGEGNFDAQKQRAAQRMTEALQRFTEGGK